jgi:hypothetical protein
VVRSEAASRSPAHPPRQICGGSVAANLSKAATLPPRTGFDSSEVDLAFRTSLPPGSSPLDNDTWTTRFGRTPRPQHLGRSTLINLDSGASLDRRRQGALTYSLPARMQEAS